MFALPYFIAYSKAKLVCYSGCLLTSYFCISIPYDERIVWFVVLFCFVLFFWCLFQKVLQVFIEPVNFNFFSISGWGINLCYCCCLVAKVCLTLLQSHELQLTRILCPWDFSGKNSGVGCNFLFQGIFPAQGLNPYLLGRWTIYR